MRSTKILTINTIKKSYNGNVVLNVGGISINSGEIYGLIGPNGAGKSTLMKIISSLTKADSGDIELFGKTLSSKNKTQLVKNIGVFVEGPAYYGHLTAKENMKILANLKGLSEDEVAEAINYVGLANQMNKKVATYSLGMKQRLGLAMALAGLPKFMILDEPTNGLDPQGIKEVRNLILDLSRNKGITIMISSHIMHEIEKVVDHIGILNKGNLLYQGAINDFKNKFGSEIAFKTSNNEMALTLLDDYHPKITKDYMSIKSVENSEIPKIIQLLNNYNLDIYRIYDVSKSLEDLFIDLTKEGSL